LTCGIEPNAITCGRVVATVRREHRLQPRGGE
jgi:hypothetical protein